jgi:hypothetical protein
MKIVRTEATGIATRQVRRTKWLMPPPNMRADALKATRPSKIIEPVEAGMYPCKTSFMTPATTLTRKTKSAKYPEQLK